MGEIVYNEFNNLFAEYHPNDYSLVCNNNVLYYGGDNKTIYGNIRINYGDSFNIENFPIRNIDPAIWRQEPYILFFIIRESIKHSYDNDVQSRNEIYNFNTIIHKNNLSDNEKLFVSYELDYYLALNSIRPFLRDGLYDYFKTYFDKIIPGIFRTPSNQLTEGIEYAQNKLSQVAMQNIQDENNIISTLNNNIETDSGESRGYQRTNRKSGVHYSESMFSAGNSSRDFIKDTTAYINAVIILLITISAILIALMVIFNL